MADHGNDTKSNTESVLTNTFLNLEEIDPLLFRSTHLFKPTFGRAVFGGQVVGQALVAASKTTDKGREAHSLHCYFLRPGKIDNPILYQVLKIRDGLTYSNRFVRATQLGRTIFTMMVSFKEAEADNFSHQFEMPKVPGPEELLDVPEILKQRLGHDDIHDIERTYIEKRLTEEFTMTVKPVDPETILRRKDFPAKQCMWLKVNGHIGDNEEMQRCAAAYMSDSYLLSTAILPGASKLGLGKYFMTSIDHSIWFHHHIRADDWLLYEMESPKCGDGRALNNGRIWDRKGKLLLSVSQEGVVKPFTKPGEGSLNRPNLDQGRTTGHVGGPGGRGASPSLDNLRRYSTATGGLYVLPARYNRYRYRCPSYSYTTQARQAKISTVINMNSLLAMSKRLVRLI